MPRGEHLAELNKQRAADRAKILEAGQAAESQAPIMPGPEEIVETDFTPPEPLEDTEAERLRRHNLELVEELRALRAFMPALHFPTAAPIIAKPMPPNYSVWMGPEPPNDVQLCMSARGRVRCIPKREEFTMTDGDGHGKTRTITGTTHGGMTTDFIDSGFTSIEFDNRCPPGHKYAGRLYARIDCPEHAAYLQLTAGKDRQGNQMFKWFLVTQFRNMYEQLKRSHMRKREVESIEIEDVGSQGSAMPLDA